MPNYVRVSSNSLPSNVVTVHVWKSMGRTMADIVAPPPHSDIAEMPRPVPAALRRACEICEAADIDCIAVVVDEDTVWNDDWGALR